MESPTQARAVVRDYTSLALVVGGVVLIVLGISAMESFSSDVSRLFTGAPTEKSVWLLIGGIVAVVAGSTFSWRNRKST
jgi:uncharacterized membrane protein YidH (DUF202 family)